MSYTLEGKQLQSYIEEVNDTYITIPGYEIYFYSRFDANAKVTGDYANHEYVDVRGMDEIKPTQYISSDDLPTSVLDISLANSLDEEVGGSTGTIQIIFPNGDDFFKATIGDPDHDSTDFDYSPGNKIHKIGTMDTIIVRLKNAVKNTADEKAVVFRGVISAIRRQTSIGGNLITLQVMDHSEWLRQAVALRLSWFSTISLSLTGRQLISNLVDYANVLYSGDKDLLNALVGAAAKVTQAVSNEVTKDILAALGEQTTKESEAEADLQYTNKSISDHRLEIPPFISFTKKDAILSGTEGGGIKKAFDVVTRAFKSIANGDPPGISELTKEDAETIAAYSVAHVNAHSDTQTISTSPTDSKVSVTYNQNKSTFKSVQAAGWIYSDLYIEPGLITFEHAKLWNTMQKVAGRALREVFFEFVPKVYPLSGGKARLATVKEIKENPNLKDAHPNLAPLTYRLSPCMLPYVASKVSTSEFYMWEVKDDEVISYDTVEDERNVKTAVLTYGTTIDKDAISTFVKNQVNAAITGGEMKNGAIVQSLDDKHRIERRLGYRYLTDHDMKITYPVIKYFLGNILLQKSQLTMFGAKVTVLGNPKYQPGSIVRLAKFNSDYYCTSVEHHWSINQGYVTTLGLAFGHKSGILPLSYTNATLGSAASIDELNCAADYQLIDGFVKDQKVIGGFNTNCLVKAIWQVATGQAKGNLEQFTKEYNTANPITDTKEWIDLYKCSLASQLSFILPISFNEPPPVNFTASGAPISKPVSNGITITTLMNTIQKYTNGDTGFGYIPSTYNITPNLVLNVMRQESNFVVNAVATDHGYGLMQLTSGGFFDANYTRLNATQIGHLDETIKRGVKYLSDHIVARCKSPENARGTQFLLGLADYNGHSEYPTQVLGPDQVRAINSNSRTPKDAVAQKTQNGLKDGKRYPYGPLGVQVHEIDSKTPKPPTSDARYNEIKKQLLDFNQGMPMSIAFIVSLMKKYSKPEIKFAYGNALVDIPNNAQYGDTKGLAGMLGGRTSPMPSHANDDLLSKVVAQWYTDLDVNAASSDEIDGVINEVRAHYQECLNCNHDILSGNSIIEEYLATSADRQALSNSNHLFWDNESRDKPDLEKAVSGDLVHGLNALIAKGYYIHITALKTGHGKFTSSGNVSDHFEGRAVDFYPVDSQGRDSLAANSSEVSQFIADVSRLPKIHQIGLGGDYNIGPNIASAGSTYFQDNSFSHIHFAVTA